MKRSQAASLIVGVLIAAAAVYFLLPRAGEQSANRQVIQVESSPDSGVVRPESPREHPSPAPEPKSTARVEKSNEPKPPVLKHRQDAPDAGPTALGSRNPRSPEYDPMVLLQALDEDPWQILANEPRIAAFAEKREAQLRDIYDELLREQPKVEVNRLECFASSCVSELELSIESRDDLNRFLGQLALKPYYSAQFPRVRMNDSAGKAYVSFALLFSAEQRDHEKYEETVSLFMGAE